MIRPFEVNLGEERRVFPRNSYLLTWPICGLSKLASITTRGRSSNRRHGRSSRVRNQLHNLDVTEVVNHEDDYLYTVDTRKIKNSKPMFLVQLNGVPTKILGDSGASVNAIDEPTLDTISPKPDMQPPDINLYAYGSKEKALPLLGMFVGIYRN